jgi:hypothetical protein
VNVTSAGLAVSCIDCSNSFAVAEASVGVGSVEVVIGLYVSGFFCAVAASCCSDVLVTALVVSVAVRSAGLTENSFVVDEGPRLVPSDEDLTPSVSPEAPSELDSSTGLMIQIAEYKAA